MSGRCTLRCCRTVTHILLEIARTVLRGVLPYPDLVRRARVRGRARDLATREPWPQDETAATAADYAQLALLRLLQLQHETHRAVLTRQRESSALLARTAMETCILGLWCLHDPEAVTKLRAAHIKSAPTLLSFLSSTGLIPDALIRQAAQALGQPGKLPDLRSMAAMIDANTGATLAIHLYDQAYRPASQYFTHATSSALLRHVDPKRRRTIRPMKSWVRRAPVRLADACVGLLAGAVANQLDAPAKLFAQYAEAHASRVLPPALATIGKGLTSRLGLAGLMRTVSEALTMRTDLSDAGPDLSPDEREARLRDMYDILLTRLDLDLPPESIQPIIDHFVAKALAEWDIDSTNQKPGAARLNEA